MPRNVSNTVPTYRLHKQSGQAIVTLNRRDFTLGRFGTPESREKYNRLIALWWQNGRQIPDAIVQDLESDGPLTIDELIDSYMTWAEQHYLHPDGRPTSEICAMAQALKALRECCAGSPAIDFGPLKLKLVRDAMVRKGWVRVSVNKQIDRVKRMFKWAAGEQLIPAFVYDALRTVSGLPRGRTKAPESDPVRPVVRDHIDAVLPFLPPILSVAVQVQLLTGMRPGELTILRPIDIDRSGAVWTFKPASHKGSWRGLDRTIFIGPHAQRLLLPLLMRADDSYVFCPIESERKRRAQAHADRRTPLQYGNRPGTNRKAKPKWTAGQRYNVGSYRRAITRACDQADLWHKGGRIISNDERMIPRWHPHQLRHNAGTLVRAKYGAEAARVVLGHESIETTEIYAERDLAKAREIMAEVG